LKATHDVPESRSPLARHFRSDNHALAATPDSAILIVVGSRIAWPEMFPEAEMLPHLICSRPIFIGGAKDEADQHGGA